MVFVYFDLVIYMIDWLIIT